MPITQTMHCLQERCSLTKRPFGPNISFTTQQKCSRIFNLPDEAVDHQQTTPLLDAVLERGNRLHEKALHVPGHKRGRALDPGMQQLLGITSTSDPHNPLRCDLTEVAGLDYLSSPTGVIAAAQQAAAAALGADHTWFLVNGCSVGIHAAVMATVKPGQTILLARNCHLSAFSACVITGCNPLWLRPEEDRAHGIAHCVTPEELTAGFETAKAQGLSVGAVMVVSPTYYGAVARIEELAAICHAQGAPLLVDEAHGGHLDFIGPKQQQQQQQQQHGTSGSAGSSSSSKHGSNSINSLPVSALSAGADVVMHSSHKVLTAMTQAAMLHVKGARVNVERISKALQVLQTSSPSYILLSSLDAARRHAVTPGNWSIPLAAAEAAREGLVKLAGQSDNKVTLVQQGCCGSERSVAGFDPLRLVVNVSGLGITGFAAAERLEQEHSIVSELSTVQLVVYVFGPGSSLEDANALVAAFEDLYAMPVQSNSSNHISSMSSGSEDISSSSSLLWPSTAGTAVFGEVNQPSAAYQHQGGLSPRDAFFADTECVKLATAAGRISAELLCPYPPGVPVVFPGEVITGDAILLLQSTLVHGGVVTGAQDSSLETVLVVAESGK